MITEVNKSWTLFLDRDGVINHRIPGQYISDPADLKLTQGSEQAIASANLIFGQVVVVTNQAGIGKGIMTTQQLEEVHLQISKRVARYLGRIDKYYFCPERPAADNECRKPAAGMALAAQKDFPNIDFSKSIMVGDSISDIEFGKKLGMKTVLVSGKEDEEPGLLDISCDLKADSLFEFMAWINRGELL